MRFSSIDHLNSQAGNPPLAGMSFRVESEASRPLQIAAALFVELGASPVVLGDRSCVDLILGPAGFGGRASVGLAWAATRAEGHGLADATLDYALGLALVVVGAAALLSGGRYEVDPGSVAAQFHLPWVLADAYGAPLPGPVASPVPSQDGALYCEVQSDDDRELYERLCASSPPSACSAAAFASRAQALGLAVFDFRRRETAELDLPLFYAVEDARPSVSYPRSGVSSDGAPLTGVRICDLTALWAGPLATWLLASLGAVVIKIEPTIRLDGFRALDGRGIYPKGKHVPGNGNRSGLFNALNRNKARIDLDLREPEDRCKFLGLVAGADLVIHNLSPRAVSNLAIERASIVGSGSSRLVTIAMPGFPPGSPERDWRAYGGGIHAVSGLADTGDQRWFIPPVSYPDVLSGFAAAAVATVFLLASLRRGRGWDVELPLLNVASRLHSLGGAGPDGSIRATSAVLSRAAHGPPLVDGAGLHRYPRSPFSGPGVPVPEAPAPALIIP